MIAASVAEQQWAAAAAAAVAVAMDGSDGGEGSGERARWFTCISGLARRPPLWTPSANWISVVWATPCGSELRNTWPGRHCERPFWIWGLPDSASKRCTRQFRSCRQPNGQRYGRVFSVGAFIHTICPSFPVLVPQGRLFPPHLIDPNHTLATPYPQLSTPNHTLTTLDHIRPCSATTHHA